MAFKLDSYFADPSISLAFATVVDLSTCFIIFSAPKKHSKYSALVMKQTIFSKQITCPSLYLLKRATYPLHQLHKLMANAVDPATVSFDIKATQSEYERVLAPFFVGLAF